MKTIARKRFWVGMLVMVLVSIMVLAGCSTTSQVSNVIMYDNAPLMARPYDILSQTVVRVEIVQVESARRSTTTRSIHDRVLENVKETYPNADAVLVSSIEAVGKVTTSRSGTTESYTYVINVFPIKYR